MTFFLLVMLTISLSVTAEIYTRVDEDGKKHFSDQPPVEQNIKSKVAKEIELHNIDAGYPAGTVVDPTRKRRKKQKALQRATAAEKMNQACSRAKTDLGILSSRVIFRNEDGGEVRVSEKDRIKMEANLRALIKEQCG